MQHKFLPKKLDIITISIRNFALIILELDKCPLDKCPTTGWRNGMKDKEEEGRGHVANCV